MDRRAFVTSFLLTAAASLQAVMNHNQKQTNQEQTEDLQKVRRDQRSLVRVQLDQRTQADRTESLQAVLFRITCESMSAQSGIPVTSLRDFIQSASYLVHEGHDVFTEDFWSLAVERYLETADDGTSGKLQQWFDKHRIS